MFLKTLPDESRTKDALTRILKGEKVDISLYPVKINESSGKDHRLKRLRHLATKFPDLFAHEGDVYWLKNYEQTDKI